MSKFHKKWMGILIIASLFAVLYTACSKSAIESVPAVEEEASPEGFMLKTDDCTCGTECDYGNVDSTYIYRHDATCIGDCWPYNIQGLTFSSSISNVDTVSVCGGVSTCSGDFHIYFYNEKTGCTGTPTGQPLLILDNTKVQAVAVGKGMNTFNQYYCIDPTCYNWGADYCCDLPLGTDYRCSENCNTPLDKNQVASFANSYLTIGNDFQNTNDDFGPSDQTVYLLKIKKQPFVYYYYALMVSRFKNGTVAPAKFNMTIRYRLLGICN